MKLKRRIGMLVICCCKVWVPHLPLNLVFDTDVDSAAVLDDGYLTDSQGRKVDFRNTIIIMTSNLGMSEGFFFMG